MAAMPETITNVWEALAALAVSAMLALVAVKGRAKGAAEASSPSGVKLNGAAIIDSAQAERMARAIERSAEISEDVAKALVILADIAPAITKMSNMMIERHETERRRSESEKDETIREQRHQLANQEQRLQAMESLLKRKEA